MLIQKILILGILMVIFAEDFRSRSVHWFLFPLAALLLILIRLRHQYLGEIMQTTAINLFFIFIQIFALSAYFSLKKGRWINITQQLLGIGDILFLCTMAIYLSVLNNLFFYIISLFITLLTWTILRKSAHKKNDFIPLAGVQSLILIVFLSTDWLLSCFDLTSDTWILSLINK